MDAAHSGVLPRHGQQRAWWTRSPPRACVGCRERLELVRIGRDDCQVVVAGLRRLARGIVTLRKEIAPAQYKQGVGPLLDDVGSFAEHEMAKDSDVWVESPAVPTAGGSKLEELAGGQGRTTGGVEITMSRCKE